MTVDADSNGPPLSRIRRWRTPLMLAGASVGLALGGYVYFAGARFVATDDAYVQAGRVSICADVTGRVAAMEVRDNQPVNAGQVLFRVDDRSYRIAVAEAEARLAAALLDVEARKATYLQKQALLAAAESALAYRQREDARKRTLQEAGAASRSAYDEADHELTEARERFAASRQDVAIALAALGGDALLPPERHPAVMQAQAALDRARLDLSHTLVTAPGDGVVAKVDQLQVGDFVVAAQPAFSLILDRRPWIEANVKETDLSLLREGQKATVAVDAYPGQRILARVAAVSPGAGSAFSLLPAENATGNWVKVVQRVPVRLELDAIDPATPLRAGMSVSVEVDTLSGADAAAGVPVSLR